MCAIFFAWDYEDRVCLLFLLRSSHLANPKAEIGIDHPFFWTVANLFVGKDKKDGIPEFVFVEHSHELFSRFSDSLSIVGINNENKT